MNISPGKAKKLKAKFEIIESINPNFVFIETDKILNCDKEYYLRILNKIIEQDISKNCLNLLSLIIKGALKANPELNVED